jgi:hypothetical protein
MGSVSALSTEVTNRVELQHQRDVDCFRRGVAQGTVSNYWTKLGGRIAAKWPVMSPEMPATRRVADPL